MNCNNSTSLVDLIRMWGAVLRKLPCYGAIGKQESQYSRLKQTRLAAKLLKNQNGKPQ